MIDKFRIKTECAICPIKIWQKKGLRLVKNSEYHEVKVKLNDSSFMTVAVCTAHAEPSRKDLTTMIHKIHDGWLEEVALGIGNAKWVQDRGLTLQIVGVAS